MGLLKLGGLAAVIAVVGLVPTLIIGVVVFGLVFALIYALGLVSAIIWLIGAVGLIWILSLFHLFDRDNVGKHPKILLIFAIIPLFFMIGYATDHVKGLNTIAPSQFISTNPYLTVQQMSIQGDAVTFIMTPLNFAVILAVIAIPVIAVTYHKLKHK